jgi:hypothetical protein
MTPEEIEKIVTACYVLIDYLIDQGGDGDSEIRPMLNAVREIQHYAENGG